MGHNLKAVLCQQMPVLVRFETGVVERLPCQGPVGLVARPTASEQQDGPRLGVAGETREQLSLIFRGEVEDAVPGDQAIERAARCEMAHVADLPGRARKP